MKKVKEAFIRGQSGENADEITGRAARVAHRLGNASYKSAQKYDEALTDQKNVQLDQAKMAAKGPSKKALEIIEVAASIPHQADSKPKWGIDFVSEETGRTRQWNARFTFGRSKDDTRTDGTPLAQDIGTIKIDSTDWSHNGINRPIDSVSMVTEAQIAEDGSTEPPTTTFWLNTRPYTMTDEDLQRDFGVSTRLDFDGDGNLSYLGMSRSGQTGYQDQDASKAQVNIDEVMDNLMSSVQATAREYQQLGEGLQ